jgi:hypothetical protein
MLPFQVTVLVATVATAVTELALAETRFNVEMPADVSLHLIVDNYGTHKHPNVRSCEILEKIKRARAAFPAPTA